MGDQVITLDSKAVFEMLMEIRDTGKSHTDGLKAVNEHLKQLNGKVAKHEERLGNGDQLMALWLPKISALLKEKNKIEEAKEEKKKVWYEGWVGMIYTLLGGLIGGGVTLIAGKLIE